MFPSGNDSGFLFLGFVARAAWSDLGHAEVVEGGGMDGGDGGGGGSDLWTSSAAAAAAAAGERGGGEEEGCTHALWFWVMV